MYRSIVFKEMETILNYLTIAPEAKPNLDNNSEEEVRFFIMNYSDGFILEFKNGSHTCFYKLLVDADNQRIQEIMPQVIENRCYDLNVENGLYIISLIEKGNEIFERGEKSYHFVMARLGYKFIRVLSPEMQIYYCENNKTAKFLTEQFQTDRL